VTRVLWHSNAPFVGTGYGQQTALFAPRLEDIGYETAVSAFFGLQGSPTTWNDGRGGRDLLILPGGQDPHGNDVLGRHAQEWFKGKGGLLVTLTDVWVLAAEMIAQLPCLAWVPIDHTPAPSLVLNWFHVSNAIPLAMSRFGEASLRDAGLDPLYVPHGVDTSIFCPGDRAEGRKAIDVPEDLFVVGMVAANAGRPSRKGFSQALQAYAAFASAHTDVALYLHTKVVSSIGENLSGICSSLGIRPYAVDQYKYQAGLDQESVAKTMRGIDVLLNPSHGEGFGLTTLEAQACGTPVIATNFSAMAEVVGKDAGWLVDGQYEWTNFEAWQLCPDVSQIITALEQAYDEWKCGNADRALAAVEHIQQYESEHVLNDYWKPALREAELRTRWDRQQPVVRRGR